MASKIWAIFACAASTGLVLCQVYKFYQPSLLCHHWSGLTISSNEGGLLLGNSSMDAKIKQRTNSDKQQQLQSVLMCPAHSLSLQCIPTTSLQLYISATWILCLKLSLSLFLSFLLPFFSFLFLSFVFSLPLSPSLPICATLWSYSGWCIAHTQMQDQWEHVLCHQVLQLPFLHLKQNSQVKSGWLKRKPFVYCIYLHSIVATFLGTRLCVVWSHQHILLDHVGSFLPRVLSDLFCWTLDQVARRSHRFLANSSELQDASKGAMTSQCQKLVFNLV